MANAGMGFPALHFFKRAEPGVGVIQARHQAQRHFVVFQVVHETAAIGFRVHGPAGGVDDQTRLVFFGFDFPELFHAQRIGLWVFARVQLIACDELFAQMAPRSFGEQGVFRMQFHAELKIGGGLAVFAQTLVAGGHAFDRTVVVVEHFCGGEAGVNLNAQTLCLRAQPAREIGQADGVVAMVVKTIRNQPLRCVECAFLGQEEHLVGGHGLAQGCAQLFPVRQQLVQCARVHDCTAQNMSARL